MIESSHPPIHYGPVWPTAEERASHGHEWGSYSLCETKEAVTMSTHKPWITCPKCRRILQLPAPEVAQEPSVAVPSALVSQGVLL